MILIVIRAINTRTAHKDRFLIPGARPFVGHFGQAHHKVFQFALRPRGREEAQTDRDKDRQQEAPQGTIHIDADRFGLPRSGDQIVVQAIERRRIEVLQSRLRLTSTPGSKMTGTASTPNWADSPESASFTSVERAA